MVVAACSLLTLLFALAVISSKGECGADLSNRLDILCSAGKLLGPSECHCKAFVTCFVRWEGVKAQLPRVYVISLKQGFFEEDG